MKSIFFETIWTEMKYTAVALAVLAAVLWLTGCSSTQRVTEHFYRDKDGNVVKETRTVSETIRLDTRKPVYKWESEVKTGTRTTENGVPSANHLHTVTPKSEAPAAVVIPDAK